MKKIEDKRLRQLCPKECLRLMGFTDSDYKALKEAGLTDYQIIHAAGDSICVNVLMAIFGKMLGQEDSSLETTIKDYVKNKLKEES